MGIFLKFLMVVSLTGKHVATRDIVNPTKYELLKYLLDPRRYDSSIFPGYFTGNQSDVIVQLAVTDINDISDPGMEFQMILYLRMQWEDTRLIYIDNATYDKLEITGDKVDQVWTPDIYFLDERRSGIHKINSVEKLVYIHPYGQVSYSERLSVTSHCNMDLKKFPFDNQNCTIILQSCGNFSFLQTSILFKRIGTSYISMYIAPYPIFFGLATASFGLKEIGPKMTACSGALSTTILQWIAIYAKLPAITYLSDLDAWILHHVIFIGAIFLYHIIHFWLKNLFEKPESKENTKQNVMNDFANIQKSANEEIANQDKPKRKDKANQDEPEHLILCCYWKRKDKRWLNLFKSFFLDKTRTTICLDLPAGCLVSAVYTLHSIYYVTNWGLGHVWNYAFIFGLIPLILSIHCFAYNCFCQWKDAT